MKKPIPRKENVDRQATAREPNMAGNRFSIKLVIVAFVFTGAALAWLSWSTYDLYTNDTIIKASEEYETQKRIYSLGMENFFTHLETRLDANQKSELNRAGFSAGAGIVVLAILLFIWLAIMRRLYKAHAVL